MTLTGIDKPGEWSEESWLYIKNCKDFNSNGVANYLNAAQSHKYHYGVAWVKYNRCYVTGVESEIKKYWKNDVDAYKGVIRSVVDEELIREEYKDQGLVHSLGNGSKVEGVRFLQVVLLGEADSFYFCWKVQFDSL